MKNEFVDAMGRLALAPGFERVKRLSASRSWLDYVNLSEVQRCRVLQWLLTPTEGHGQRDYFIRCLLTVAHRQISEDEIEDRGLFTPAALLEASFSSAVVATEVCLPDGRVDLVLLDHPNEIVVVVERKDGTTVHTNQLARYERWFDENYKDYGIYYLLLDSQDMAHDLPSRWVQLDDGWLIEALENLLNADMLPQYVEQQLRDLLYYVFKEWDEKTDPFYYGREKFVARFAHDHEEELKDIRTATVIRGKRAECITQLSTAAILGSYLPGPLSKTDKEALLLYMGQSAVIGDLLDYTAADFLAGIIDKRYPELEYEWFSGPQKAGMYVVNKRHTATEKQAEDNGWWPYYLAITMQQVPDESSDDSAEKIRMVSASVHPNRRCHEELKWIAEEFAEIYDIRTRGTEWLSATKVLLNPIENLNFEDSRHPLSAVLDDFIARTRDIAPNS